MDNYQLVVGTKDCPLNTVASFLRQSSIIRNEWFTFARQLDVPSDQIKMFRKELLLNKITFEDLMFEVLEIWIGNNDSKATLFNLLQVVEGHCGANDVGEKLRLQYKLPCKNASLMKVKGLPEPLSYYVNRTIATRNIISDQIFEQDSSDIFLFTGMDRYELSRLAKDKLTGSSREQLQGGFNVNFMVLDQASHFERICDKANNTVHLLRRQEDGKMSWMKSNGEIENLLSYIHQKQDELDEEQFCQICTSRSLPVLICDSPGMGKSVLLAQIGHRLVQLHPERTILFIVISEFIKLAKSFGTEEKVQMIELTLQDWTEDALPQPKVNGDDEAVLIELLLDGYDEVDSADRKLALEILQTISKSFKCIRLWITSRQHLLEELENNLNILGYNIRPFTEKNQVHFLSSFWSQKHQLDQEKVQVVAKNCLKSLKAKMNSTDNDIAGIPLQCLLIGEVYADDAVEYAKLAKENETRDGLEFEIAIITNLYRQLIKKKLEKYKSAFGITKWSEGGLMTIHSHLSLELLFPVEHEILKLTKKAGELDIDEVMKGGIVTSTPTTAVTFLHRTFAEYFVAWFVVDKLQQEEEWTPELANVLLKIMSCSSLPRYGTQKQTEFRHPVICSLLNSMLANIQLEILPNNFPSKLNANIQKLVEDIAIACIEDNFVQIFKLLEALGTLDKLSSKFFNVGLLLHAVRKSSVELVKSVLAHFERYHHFDSEAQKATLREAVKNGKFSILEFLLKEKGLMGLVKNWDGDTNLVCDCVQETMGSSKGEINERRMVLYILVGINGSLVDGFSGATAPPLLSDNIHLKLRIELVRLGANLLVQNREGETILHLSYSTTTFHMTRQDYHTLVISIPTDKLKILVHLQTVFVETALMTILRKFDPLPETLHIFHGVGADLNHVNQTGDSVLAVAIKNDRNAETIRMIIRLGADLNGVDKEGNTPLHLVAQSDRSSCYSIIQHLLENGSNPAMLNNRNETFFHDFLRNNKWNQSNMFQLFKSIWDERSLWTPSVATLAIGYAVGDEAFPDKDLQSFAIECKAHGADFKWKDDKCNSLLHLAAKNGKISTVKILIKMGINVNSTNNDGQSPLHIAATSNHKTCLEIIICLIESGANPTDMTDRYENVLHFAALGSADALQYFLEMGGVNVNLMNVLGDTPLHCVINHGDKSTGVDCLEKCKLLIQHGADTYCSNSEGNTPLRMAMRRPDKDELLIKLLSQSSMDLGRKIMLRL